MRHTLAIDFGSRYIGLALVAHPTPRQNAVRYAATVVVETRPLNDLSQGRVQSRRIRRTRKTHKRRLAHLADALYGIEGVEPILRFCRRRGFSYDPADEATTGFQISRAEFFAALAREVERQVPPDDRGRVLSICSRHLNEECTPSNEVRPARFDNRGPSKCRWEGCGKNVPKSENDLRGRLQQSLYVWAKPVFDASSDKTRLRRSVDHWIAELDALAHALAKCATKGENEASDARRRRIDNRIRRVYKLLVARMQSEAPSEVGETFAENWSKHYRKNITAIVRGMQGGRVRYCRRHSTEFVERFLAGEVIPNRLDITESDLIARRQQILFRRLWRLVEARLLPLAGGKIDRIVVERVAIDVLAGKFTARCEMPEERAAEMYWQGPMYGFASRAEMLKEEFGGRCAYCADGIAATEVEHILPQSQFPFDSYLNVLPTCATCNARKGARTPLQAGMSVTQETYDSYCAFVEKRAVPHQLHVAKKGILKLLLRQTNDGQGERLLSILASNLVAIATTQRSPRPLARYLATKLADATGIRPEFCYTSGRHTALFRGVVLPAFDKAREKGTGGIRNHAVDAILLGCDFPSAPAMENQRWISADRVRNWLAAVRHAAPTVINGLPVVGEVDAIPFFETHLGDGYLQVDLGAFNWNRSRKATHDLDPLGKTKGGDPRKREPAAEVLAKLQQATSRHAIISRIANRGLRTRLAQDPEHAAERFVAWLQQTTEAGLASRTMTSHPADEERERMLRAFVAAPAAEVLEGRRPIPHTIGVCCIIDKGIGNMANVVRVDDKGHVIHHLKASPSVRELWICYRERDGQIDRTRPVVLRVTQIGEVVMNKDQTPIQVPKESPLRGRPFGTRKKSKPFQDAWYAAFASYCREQGFVERHRVTQGCVVERDDGYRFQVRNFASDSAWMKRSPFKNIVRVYRSPFQAMRERNGAAT